MIAKAVLNFCSTFLLEFSDVGDIGFSLILILVVSISHGHNLNLNRCICDHLNASHFLQLVGIYRQKVPFQVNY